MLIACLDSDTDHLTPVTLCLLQSYDSQHVREMVQRVGLRPERYQRNLRLDPWID